MIINNNNNNNLIKYILKVICNILWKIQKNLMII